MISTRLLTSLQSLSVILSVTIPVPPDSRIEITRSFAILSIRTSFFPIPSPNRTRSSPAISVTTSLPSPLPNRYTSFPFPPLRASLPVPPFRVSFPSPPFRVSFPFPPLSVSLRLSIPLIVSLLSVPMRLTMLSISIVELSVNLNVSIRLPAMNQFLRVNLSERL